MHVGILGPGRLGRSLALLFERAGLRVSLLGRGEAPRGDVLLLTVPDAAIGPTARSLSFTGVLLHCSGATGVEVLRPHLPAGSFHPLMTFPGPEIALPSLAEVPVALAGDPEAVAAGRALAASLGLSPFEVPGDRRLYHAAAVLAGNLSTVLLAEAARVLEAAGIPREEAARRVLPLAIASLENAEDDPVAALTGPVVRGDDAVLAAHRSALREAGLDDVEALYDALTDAARHLTRPPPLGSGRSDEP